MYKIINEADQYVYAHRDEEGNIVLDDFTFEVEDTNIGKQYRIIAYSLQDGTDNIRVSFDLWNEDEECFEEIGYGFYDSDGGQICDSAGEDIEDLELQNKVTEKLFDCILPTFRTVEDLDDFFTDHQLDIINL